MPRIVQWFGAACVATITAAGCGAASTSSPSARPVITPSATAAVVAPIPTLATAVPPPAAATVLATPAAVAADPTAGWKTYSNAKYGFTLRYPPAWMAGGGFNDGAGFPSAGQIGSGGLILDPDVGPVSFALYSGSADTAIAAYEQNNNFSSYAYRATFRSAVSNIVLNETKGKLLIWKSLANERSRYAYFLPSRAGTFVVENDSLPTQSDAVYALALTAVRSFTVLAH